MNTCEYRVGFAALLERAGGPTPPEWADEDDPTVARTAIRHWLDICDTYEGD